MYGCLYSLCSVPPEQEVRISDSEREQKTTEERIRLCFISWSYTIGSDINFTMDDMEMIAQSVIKFEDIKQEADDVEVPLFNSLMKQEADDVEEPVWNSTELSELCTLKSVVKKDNYKEEELKPPVTLFLEAMKEEIKEEYEDPSTRCSELDFDALEERLLTLGEECATADRSSESQNPMGRAVEECLGVDSWDFSGEGVASTLMNPEASTFECLKCKRNLSENASSFPMQNNPKNTYNCSICKKNFVTRGNLVTHLIIHSEDNDQHISDFQKTFRERINLVMHKRIYTGERNHDCPVCQKSFRDRAILVLHLWTTHTGARPRYCCDCEESFSERKLLLSHTRVHRTEFHQCPVCQKNFTRRGNLTRHMRIHTGERSHNCSVCHKNFVHQDGLVKHMRAHTEKDSKTAS